MRNEPTAAESIGITPQDFLWAVGSVCNLRRRLFDATLIQREFPPPHTAVTVVEALRSLDLDVRLVVKPWHALAVAALPRLTFLRASADGGDNPAFRPALLAKVEADRVLLFPAGTNEPKV